MAISLAKMSAKIRIFLPNIPVLSIGK